MRRLSNGSYVIAKLDGQRKLLMQVRYSTLLSALSIAACTQGAGASPEGNRPFLSVLDLDTGTRSEVWRSQPPCLEALGSILSDTDDAPITLNVRGDATCMHMHMHMHE